MLSVTTPLIVEWEDCDPAGIVFYPRFFTYFDRGAWNLWIAAGLTREVIRELGAIGMPAMEARAAFSYPCRFKDALRLVSAVSELREKSITVAHHIYNGEHLAVTGHEVRFWGLAHPADPLRLKAGEIPRRVVEMLRA
jgi:4-hydroxybenzoyl-CoA thioesterase